MLAVCTEIIFILDANFARVQSTVIRLHAPNPATVGAGFEADHFNPLLSPNLSSTAETELSFFDMEM